MQGFVFVSSGEQGKTLLTLPFNVFMQKHELSDKIVVIDDICYKTILLSFIILRVSLMPFVYIFGKPVEIEDSKDLSVFGVVTWVMKKKA